MPEPSDSSILALDIGDKRVGLAVASLAARLPRPLTTLLRSSDDNDFMEQLKQVIEKEKISLLVIGLPRNMSGDNTLQTESVKRFASLIEKQTALPIAFQDEAATSVAAEAELKARAQPYSPGDIDALAATYILEDYLSSS